MREVLKVSSRNKKGKQFARKVRKEGKIPGIIYGHGEESLGVLIDRKEFVELLGKLKSESTILDILVDSKEKLPCIIKSIQKNPFNDQLLNVDFQHIHLKEKISVKVPIMLKGESPGIKQGGILDHHLREVEIKCLPDDVLPHIEVDISKLKMGDSLHISDLHFDRIEFLAPKDTTVVSILVPKEVAAPPPTEELKEPELIREKKEVKEEESEEEVKSTKAEKPKEEKEKSKA